MDNIVDRMKDEAFVTLVERMKQDPERAQAYLDVLLISRNLERVADHATNISEDVIFWVRGADVRHRVGLGSGRPDVCRSNCFRVRHQHFSGYPLPISCLA